ncbi:MAG TPA: hypothetical protein VF006_10705 [Longimicrobium sp.]
MSKAGAEDRSAAPAEDGVEGVPRMAVGSVRVLPQALLGSTCYKMPHPLEPGMVQMTHAAEKEKKIGLTQSQRSQRSFLVPRRQIIVRGSRRPAEGARIERC